MSATDPTGIQAFPAELADRDAWLDPFDWYGSMRDSSPIRFDEARATWDVFRHADVKRVLEDDGTFSVEPRHATDFVEPTDFGEGLLLQTMLLSDPPRHDELRAVVDDAFQPRALRELEPQMREITNDLLDDALSGDGRFDVIEELAYPFPVVVIAELLGVPAGERDRFKRWSDAIVASTGQSGDEDVMEQMGESLTEMGMYFLELITSRREDPRDDLVSRMVSSDVGTDATLSQEAALGTCVLLLVAGNITTTNFIGNAVRCFDEADCVDGLIDGDIGLSIALEEALRYRSPVQAMGRIATRDVELAGETVSAGDHVVAWIGSANRDERRFERADTFLPDRSPNQHLAFGQGTHYCLGAPLARLEARVVFEELFRRVDDLSIAETSLQPTRSSFVYGVESLPVSTELSDDA